MADREIPLRAAVEKDPENPAAHSELAAHYYAAGEIEKSVQAYRLALELAPDVVQGHYNLAATLNTAGDSDEALAVIEEAERAFPNEAVVHYGKACILQSLGRLDDALASYTRSLELDPVQAHAFYGAGVVLLRQGHPARAANCIESALAISPDYSDARYLHEALSGEMRRRPEGAFVRQLFDSYAPYYDEHMVGQLGYRAPEILGRAVGNALGDASGLSVLDLGCGTGLLGETLRPYASQMIGVDLASAMLDRADATGIYDTLEHCDVVDYLELQEADSQELIVAADVFIYFAELEPVFADIRRVLKPGGLFAFSVEEFAGDGWKISLSGRFQHSSAYLESLRDGLGYSAVSFERTVLRHEGRVPCHGFIVLWTTEN